MVICIDLFVLRKTSVYSTVISDRGHGWIEIHSHVNLPLSPQISCCFSRSVSFCFTLPIGVSWLTYSSRINTSRCSDMSMSRNVVQTLLCMVNEALPQTSLGPHKLSIYDFVYMWSDVDLVTCSFSEIHLYFQYRVLQLLLNSASCGNFTCIFTSSAESTSIFSPSYVCKIVTGHFLAPMPKWLVLFLS